MKATTKSLALLLLSFGAATIIACSGAGNNEQSIREIVPSRREPVVSSTDSHSGTDSTFEDNNSSLDHGLGNPNTSETEIPLVMEGWHYGNEYSYIIAEGRVTNVTNYPIRNLLVVVQYFTDDGKFVKSSQGVVEYNPIMPGQTSPFKTIDSGNPQIKRAHIEFKELFGGTVACTNRQHVEDKEAERKAAVQRSMEVKKRKRAEIENSERIKDLQLRAPLAWKELRSEIGEELTPKTRLRVREFAKEFKGTTEGELADNESQADGMWALVKQYERTQNKLKAFDKAKEIVAKFPDTISATLAKNWLSVAR